ncbi:DgyrCDS5040 [Dimorphilus gyrociliatus]|uniref:DgyrCDS5040 n=1 Tax=Dimorphilus gyrociliatus TaxID=2664684 RepID=A0A7I8VNF2_9ANNE|nr:DgyrCDS5040 [Dimorphilus gyrociliatus]
MDQTHLPTLIVILILMLMKRVEQLKLSEPLQRQCDDLLRKCHGDLYLQAHDFYRIEDLMDPPEPISKDYADKACIILRTVSNCIESQIKKTPSLSACRSTTSYVWNTGLFKRKMQNYSCSASGKLFDPSVLPTEPSMMEYCALEDSHTPRLLCSLTSASHLKTYKGQMNHCLTEGSSVLVDNEYLHVVTTAEKLVSRENYHPVLVLKKVGLSKRLAFLSLTAVLAYRGRAITVVFKSHPKDECSPEENYLSYTASSDEQLPVVLSNGLTHGGGKESRSIRLLRPSKNETEIYVRYMNSTIVIRHSSLTLSISIAIPQLFTVGQDSFQLCSDGCERDATEDVQRFLAKNHKTSYAENICRKSTVDQYFDCCVFDALVFGNHMATPFSIFAQRDAVRLQIEKGFLTALNRTDFTSYKIAYSRASERNLPFTSLILFSFIFILLKSIC